MTSRMKAPPHRRAVLRLLPGVRVKVQMIGAEVIQNDEWYVCMSLGAEGGT